MRNALLEDLIDQMDVVGNPENEIGDDSVPAVEPGMRIEFAFKMDVHEFLNRSYDNLYKSFDMLDYICDGHSDYIGYYRTSVVIVLKNFGKE